MKIRFLLLLIFCCSQFVLAQNKRSYNIGILIDKKVVELEPLLTQLKNEIRAVVGEDAVIHFPESSFLVNNFDLTLAEKNYGQLLNDDTDIILAFGVANNKVISEKAVHEKPTILFGAVNSDFSDIDFEKRTSGVKNLTYLIESESYLQDMTRFKELTNFKNLGIAIDAHFVDILPLKELFDAEMKQLDASYKLIPFNNVDDITSNLEGIDAIYLAGGFFLSNVEVQELAQLFIERKLPSFTVNGTDDVMAGIMATNQSKDNIDQFFRRVALSVEAYVNGARLSELPVYIEYEDRLTMNYNTAELVEVPIKYSLINETDFVGEFKNALSKKSYNLLNVVDQVLEKNLSLRSSEKDVEIAGQNIKSARSSYLPSLVASGSGTYIDKDLAEISGGQNPEFSTAGNLTLQQTIFSPAATANIGIQRDLEKAQQETYNAAELDLVFSAANAYFNTLILKTNAQIQLQNLNLTKRNLQIAQQNFDAGQSGKSDLLRFRSQMAQNTQAMVEAVNQLEQGFVSLNQVLNNPVGMEIDVENAELDRGIFEQYNYEQIAQLLDDPRLREPFINFLIEEATRNAPELKSLRHNLSATERNISLNSAGRILPTVALQGQYNRTFSRSGVGSEAPQGAMLLDDNYNMGLNVSIPIINSNKTNIERQTAIIQKQQLEINRDNSELNIAANVRSGVLDLVNQISNIQLSTVSEATAKEALELTQVSYSNGAVNIVQLLDAQNNYLSAQVARANATYNYLINSLQLERNLGYYFLLNSQESNDQFTIRFQEFLNR